MCDTYGTPQYSRNEVAASIELFTFFDPFPVII
jgi:hypothetical protein